MSDRPAAVAYSLENVKFSYGGPTVLDIPQLEIPRAQITALIGPNGSGKSTLLHVLGFLRAPAQGSLSFFGESVDPTRPHEYRRRVAMLLQHPYLFRTSVRGNVEWGLKARGVPRRERRRRAESALDRAGLAGFEGRAARHLSVGEAQRVALARALALEAEVLLLDEPLAPMDPESAQRTEDLLRDMKQNAGATVVFSTHDLLRGRGLADRALSFRAGTLVPAALANVFRGRAVEGGRAFDTGRVVIHLASPSGNAAHAGIDPAHIVLSRQPLTSSMRNEFRGRIVAIAEDEGRVRVEVDVGERFHALITHESLEILELGLRQEICLSFKSSAVKVF